ncbi:MAG: YfhO family protein [Anaerolineae bacterium]|nr:YfhO family protein [Anaerolineae bacterium]
MKFKLQGKWLTAASLLLLALLSFLFLWRVAFKGDILLSADMLLLYEPWRSELPGAKAVPIWNEKTADPLFDSYGLAVFIKESWRQGQVPLWYPYVGLGLPIVGRAIGQALYPVNNILWQIMDVPTAFGWSAILHLFLAGCFTHFYMRELQVGHFGSLVAAVSFSYSSHLITWLGLPFTFDPMVWIPLLFLGLERSMNRRDWRWSLLGVSGVALQILSGSLQLASYSLITLALYAVARSLLAWRQQQNWRQAIYPLFYTGLIFGLGCGLVAFQILSTLELVSTGITRAEVDTSLYIPPRNLLRLLMPDVRGTPVDGHDLSSLEFEAYLYFGLLPLFFLTASLFSKRAAIARILFGIGLLYLLVIYNVPPFYQIFRYVYPAFSSLGFYRSLYALTFLWAAAAGIGADWLLTERPQQFLKRLVGAGSFIGAVALLVTLYLAFISKYQARHFWNLPLPPDKIPSLDYYFANLLLFLFFFGLTLSLLWLWATARLSKTFFMSAAVLLLVLDLFLAHLDFTPTFPKRMLTHPPPSLVNLQQLAAQESEPFRVSGVRNMLPSDTTGMYGIASVQIHDSFLSARFSDYANLTGLRGAGHFRDIIFEPASNALLDALNVKYIYASRQVLTQGDWFSVLERMGQPQVISEHPQAGQVKYWNIGDWTQPVLFAPTNSILSYPGMLPYPATLETAIAVDPLAPVQGSITFAIYVTRPGQEPGSPLFSERLEAQDSQATWRPVVVDLADFAQQEVMISLVTSSNDGQVIPGGWADPLITDSSKFEQVYYGVNSIYRNKKSLPRAWVVHQVIPVANAAEAKERLAASDFDPTCEAVIEGELPQSVQSSDVMEIPHFVEYAPNAVKMEVAMSTPGLLVLSGFYYPGWSVYVDNVPQPLYVTNLVMRGVYLPAGNHQVEFVYEPFSLTVGLYISLGTIILLAVLLGLDWRFRRLSRENQCNE